MDYPVLSHYDPSVTDETAGSGGDEQELLCEFFKRVTFYLRFFFISIRCQG